MFKQARLKLTAWYLLIIMVISFSFSALIYQISSMEIIHFAESQRNRIERNINISYPNLPPPRISVDDELITESKQHLFVNLAIINGFILLLSGSLSYFLAGYALRPIQKITEDQKQFISDASHELKTPLTALKSLFEVSLRDKKITLTYAKKVIQQGINQTDKLSKLSNSLLELSRFDNQKLVSTQTILIKEIIKDAVSQIQPKADQKNIKIISKIR
jgi:signal transduction histidine kinase